MHEAQVLHTRLRHQSLVHAALEVVLSLLSALLRDVRLFGQTLPVSLCVLLALLEVIQRKRAFFRSCDLRDLLSSHIWKKN